MSPGMSLASINAILILSSDDASRIFAKYYTAPHHAPAGAGQAGAFYLSTVPDLLGGKKTKRVADKREREGA